MEPKITSRGFSMHQNILVMPHFRAARYEHSRQLILRNIDFITLKRDLSGEVRDGIALVN